MRVQAGFRASPILPTGSRHSLGATCPSPHTPTVPLPQGPVRSLFSEDVILCCTTLFSQLGHHLETLEKEDCMTNPKILVAMVGLPLPWGSGLLEGVSGRRGPELC